MRLAVLGNSHLAAVRRGWDLVRDDYDADLTFFASTAGTMRQLKVAGGALVAATPKVRKSLRWTSGGLDRIEGDYDAYVLVGMGVSYQHLMAILATHRTVELSDGGDHQLISEACLDTALEETVQRSVAMTVARRLKKITDAPLVCCPNPLPSTEVLLREGYEQRRLNGARERVWPFYRHALSAIVGPRCRVVEQPPETLAEHDLTKPEFTRDAVELKEGWGQMPPNRDFWHMNADYGALLLREVFASQFPEAVKATAQRRSA